MQSPVTVRLVERVKVLRSVRGWSAERLARRLNAVGATGLNRSVIANLESGRRDIVTVDEWLALAQVLDVDPQMLIRVEPLQIEVR